MARFAFETAPPHHTTRDFINSYARSRKATITHIMVDDREFKVRNRRLPSGNATVSLYDGRQRFAIGQLLTEMLTDGRVPIYVPWGQIQYEHRVGDGATRAELDGHLFVTDYGIISSLEMNIGPEVVSSTTHAHECLTTAEEFGTGGQWTIGLLDILRGSENSPLVTVQAMPDPSVARLNAGLHRILRG